MKEQKAKEPFLSSLLIYPTDRCNLKCRHCYFDPVYSSVQDCHVEEISYEQLCNAIDELIQFGLRSCKLSGGEPFLRKDIIDICRYIDSKNLRVIIETNGTLVGENEAEALGQLQGNTFVSVSIDGANAKTHEAIRGVPGCFQDSMRAIDFLLKSGVDVQVIACLFEANKNELPRLMEICAEKGVQSIKVNVINSTGRAKHLSLINLPEAYKIDRQLTDYASVAGITYCSSFPVGLQNIDRIIKTRGLNCKCAIKSTLGILADGTITICGMGKYADDFRFGKLGQESIAEVWTTHPTLKLIRTEIPRKLTGTCGRCIARSACLGYCRLNTESVTLDSLFDSFWECSEMERLGLFPKSRIVEHCKINSKRGSLTT